MTRIETLTEALRLACGERLSDLIVALDEVTVVVHGRDQLQVARTLRDTPALAFEELIDLAGIDYSAYGDGSWNGPRYAVVLHLLSLKHNWRVRVRSYCDDEEFPLIASVTSVWNCANWYEREAFDLYGIMFEGHPDLRRILTDYGFVGHPFRKDFPISGHVEMRYDPEQRRVVYQPVTIEPREIVPRVIREDTYGQGR
jgi:NADH-quinone oxidoreductase subunit C